jgi:8-oxo-dGTP pyrophosphatase MutT (NUDIX family)
MTEKLFHVGVKALIQDGQSRLLLALRDTSNHSIPTAPYWDLIGGRIEEGETPLDALRREIQEEIGVGYEAEPIFITATISNHQTKIASGEKVGIAIMVYRLTLPGGAEIKPATDFTTYEWVDKVDAAERLQHKYPADFISALLVS